MFLFCFFHLIFPNEFSIFFFVIFEPQLAIYFFGLYGDGVLHVNFNGCCSVSTYNIPPLPKLNDPLRNACVLNVALLCPEGD